MTRYVGVLTAGGDTPGLNAALRALGKSSHSEGFDMQLIGFYDGFRGLLHDRSIALMKVTFRASSPWAAPSWAPAATNPTACLWVINRWI